MVDILNDSEKNDEIVFTYREMEVESTALETVYNLLFQLVEEDFKSS